MWVGVPLAQLAKRSNSVQRHFVKQIVKEVAKNSKPEPALSEQAAKVNKQGGSAGAETGAGVDPASPTSTIHPLTGLFMEKTPRVDQSKKFRKIFTKGNTAQVERFGEMFATPTKPDEASTTSQHPDVHVAGGPPAPADAPQDHGNSIESTV